MILETLFHYVSCYDTENHQFQDHQSSPKLSYAAFRLGYTISDIWDMNLLTEDCTKNSKGFEAGSPWAVSYALKNA